jgi:hypothetical protein
VLGLKIGAPVLANWYLPIHFYRSVLADQCWPISAGRSVLADQCWPISGCQFSLSVPQFGSVGFGADFRLFLFLSVLYRVLSL